ncbi:MAG: response regulator transcription factor [Candidatus Obscuribacterales bacterium]|nr:response regulator transcription factor [Candidatus Obscuribacterales bacterium]
MNKKKISVMVCEDNNLMLHGLKFLLNEFGDLELVAFAKTGNEAISKAREMQPDVILMDIGLPELDGISASRIIKAERPYVRIIVVSAAQDEKTRSDAKAAGADEIFPKPVMNAEELYLTIKKVFESAHSKF